MTLELLQQFCEDNDIDPGSLSQPGEFQEDPILRHGPQSLSRGGSSGHLPRRPEIQRPKGKEPADKPNSMNPDARPPNTAVKRRQSSTHTKMVELTETQGKDIVSAMKKMSKTEDRKVTTQGDIAVKQLEYFRLRDRQISRNQQGLVDAIGGLSCIIAQAYASRTQHTNPS
jgi:hypothetical protein